MIEPCLWVRRRGEGLEVRGPRSWSGGHRLPRGGGREPDGVFAEWTCEGARVTARTDRLGMHPLYDWSSSDGIAISPSIPALLDAGAPSALDDAAISVFLRLGFFLSEDTPFRAVRAFPPAGALAWDAGPPASLNVEGALPRAPASDLPRDQALDAFVELVRQAIGRRLELAEDRVLPLSGGRDSRHIAAELAAAGRLPELCVTGRYYPPRAGDDATVAARVAAALETDHLVLDLPGPQAAAERRKNVLTGFCADEHAWYLSVADFLAPRTRAVWDGIGGDVLSAGLFLDAERLALFDAGRLEELAPRLMTTPERVLAGLLTEDAARRFDRATATDRIAAELARHREAPNPVGSFYLANRTRREIALAPYGILPVGVDALSPYLDHGVHDLLASLPARMFLDHRFHTDALARAHPRLAALPYAGPAGVARDRGHFRRFSGDVGRSVLTPRRPGVLLARAWMVPRLARGLALGAVVDWLPTAVWLDQLESLER